MKPLKEALFSRKNMKTNPFGLTKDDIKDEIRGLPMGVLVRMLEEQVKQGFEPDVKVFQNYICASIDEGGFKWGQY